MFYSIDYNVFFSLGNEILSDRKIIAPKKKNHDYHLMNSTILIDLKDLKYHYWFDLCQMITFKISSILGLPLLGWYDLLPWLVKISWAIIHVVNFNCYNLMP
jgi:hypothetical protein